MAVPNLGELQITMLGLAREKVYDNYGSTSTPTAPYSMYDLVNGGNTNGSGVSFDTTNTASPSYPNTSTPHQMSEWYSYDHDYVAVSLTSYKSTGKYANQAYPCSPTRSNTYYHDGSNQIPNGGDTIYTNSSGTSTLGAGYYGICGGPGGQQGSTAQVVLVNSSGVVTNLYLCFPAPSPNPCPP